ncbi:hypothetical protein OPV22_005596 [Ensete ventricosum]|uniref:Mitochondrial inner membrane protease subunit 2 n=1 Tax=Ensete ventricosum TaxID=4639 RepID=A0AAV8RPJ5_ENSVE|nr:hypothetical protein OPV22_005596 [Ensete ventricosum]
MSSNEPKSLRLSEARRSSSEIKCRKLIMGKWSTMWLFTKKSVTGALIGLTISDRYGLIVPVTGSSMHPTFSACDARFPGYLKADVVLVEKFCLEKYKFSHGDVITFKSPTDHKKTFVKRLIALPGDWVQVPESSEILKIPEGHCWVEGSSGFDSREGDSCDLATPTNKPSGKKEGYRENFTTLIYFVTDYLPFQVRFIQLLNLLSALCI